MHEARQLGGETLLVPTSVALRPEKDRTLIIVHPVNSVAQFAGEINAHFGADQAGGAGDEQGFHTIVREYQTSREATHKRLDGTESRKTAQAIAVGLIFAEIECIAAKAAAAVFPSKRKHSSQRGS